MIRILELSDLGIFHLFSFNLNCIALLCTKNKFNCIVVYFSTPQGTHSSTLAASRKLLAKRVQGNPLYKMQLILLFGHCGEIVVL